MRVFYLIDSLVTGGAEQSLVGMAPHLIEKGVELHVVYLLPERKLEPALRDGGAYVYDLSMPSLPIQQFGSVRRKIADLQPDLVHTTLFRADVIGRTVGRLARLPVLTTLANVPYGREQRRYAARRQSEVLSKHFFDLATAQFATRFHANSHAVAEAMGPRLLVPASRIDVVWRGRDPVLLGRRTDERHRAVRRRLGVREGERMVLCVGRHDRQKGLDTAIETAAVFRERRTPVRLFIAGRDGKQTSELKRLIDSHRLREQVVLLGDRDDVPDLLAAADVFLFPSRWEGMGGSVIEAMALEVPMVLSDLVVTREVAGDTAEYAPPGDPVAFADALERVQIVETADRVLRARRRFEQLFTVEGSAQGIFELYCRLLDRKRA